MVLFTIMGPIVVRTVCVAPSDEVLVKASNILFALQYYWGNMRGRLSNDTILDSFFSHGTPRPDRRHPTDEEIRRFLPASRLLHLFETHIHGGLFEGKNEDLATRVKSQLSVAAVSLYQTMLAVKEVEANEGDNQNHRRHAAFSLLRWIGLCRFDKDVRLALMGADDGTGKPIIFWFALVCHWAWICHDLYGTRFWYFRNFGPRVVQALLVKGRATSFTDKGGQRVDSLWANTAWRMAKEIPFRSTGSSDFHANLF